MGLHGGSMVIRPFAARLRPLLEALPFQGMGCFWPHLNSRRPVHLLPHGTRDGVPNWAGARARGAGLSACRAEGDRLLSENP